MLYITQSQLMRESEQTVLERASSTDEVPRRICTQLLADTGRYSLWHVRHEMRMSEVAEARRRERQVLKLRAIAVEQVHRTALVRYFRDNHIVGDARDSTLRTFHGISDTRDSALAEHRTFLLAASTQLCTSDILELVGDERGQELVHTYELAYGQYFGMFCDAARARQNGKPYLLRALMPEVRDVAERLRLRILDSQLLPVRPIYLHGAPPVRTTRGEPQQRTAPDRTTDAAPQLLADALRQKLRHARAAIARPSGSRPRDSSDGFHRQR